MLPASFFGIFIVNKSLSKETIARYRFMQYGVNRGGGHHDTYRGIAGVAQHYG